MTLAIADGGTGATNAADARDNLGADQAANIFYTAPATGADERSVASKLAELLSVRDFGAAGDGSTDDTAAIQAAIDAGGDNSTIWFPPGNYKITSTVRIGADRIHLRCAGGWSTRFTFAPSADDVMFHFEKSDDTNVLYGCTVTGGCAVTSADTSHAKVAFRIVDNSSFQLRDVDCLNWHSASGQGNSVVVQLAGREWCLIDNVAGGCDLAVQIQKNGHEYTTPSQTIDADHFLISRINSTVTAVNGSLTLDTGGGSRSISPSILIDTGVNLSTCEIRNCALVTGTDGIFWHDTTTVGSSTGLKISGIRFEQGTDELGYALYVKHNYALQDLAVEGLECGLGRGVYLRKCQRVSLSHVQSPGDTVGLDAVASDNSFTLRLENCFFQYGASVSTSGYYEVFSEFRNATNYAQGNVFYAYAGAGAAGTTRRNGVFTKEFTGNLASNGSVALAVGSSDGIKVARIEVAVAGSGGGSTKREGGVVVLGAGGLVRESGTANFDVGSVATKVTINQSNVPTLVNQLGEAIDYVVTAKFIR